MTIARIGSGVRFADYTNEDAIVARTVISFADVAFQWNKTDRMELGIVGS